MTNESQLREPTREIGARSSISASSLRLACLVLLIGSVAFFVGIAFPVITDFFEADGDKEAQLAVVEDNLAQFRLAWVLIGLGTSVAGLGLWLWGRALASATTGRRATAATVAAWMGAFGVPTGFARAIPPFSSAEAAVDAGGWEEVWYIAYSLATTISMLILGWLILKSTIPTWTGVLFALGGIAAIATLLPLWWYFAGIIVGIAGLRLFRPTSTRTWELS